MKNNMFKDLLEKTKQVTLKQPALANEKPEDDDVASNVGLEKPDFKKKSDPKKLDGMEIVPDKLLYDHKAIREMVIDELHDLVMELDDISEEDRALLTQAFEDGFIENQTPTIEEMVNELVDSGQVSATNEHSDDIRAMLHGLARDIPDEEFKTGLADAWIKMVVIPKVKEKYGDYDTGDDRPVESLQICNDCAKSFRAVEAVCAFCKSKNTDKIVKEEDYNAGRRQEQMLAIAVEKEIEDAVHNADGYTADGTKWPGEAEDVIEWIKENEPEAYAIILNDPEEIPEKGAEAFMAGMEAVGIVKKKKEDFRPDEDDRSGRQDRGPGPTNEYEAKIKELRLKIEELELKVKEGEGDYDVLGRGFPTQEDADRIAREKGGHVVADEDDNEKFMVIKKKEAM